MAKEKFDRSLPHVNIGMLSQLGLYIVDQCVGHYGSTF